MQAGTTTSLTAHWSCASSSESQEAKSKQSQKPIGCKGFYCYLWFFGFVCFAFFFILRNGAKHGGSHKESYHPSILERRQVDSRKFQA